LERGDLRAAGGQLLSPIVMTVLSKLGAQVLDLKSNEIDILDPAEEAGDDN